MCHWRPYLWGHSFIVRTDHYSLKFLLDQRLSTIPQHQWVSKLLGFDFQVEYRLRHQNIAAIALSRRDTELSSLAVLSVSHFDIFNDLRNEVSTVATLQALRDQILAGTAATDWN